jgi:phosphoribosylamine--glycine ligase
MRILVIGSGGREHALIWKIAQSKLVDKIFCAPGNGGISKQAECIDIKAEDIRGLLDFSRKEKIDLTVVGPEAPLASGVVDEFSNYKLRIFGPNKKAARLEGSKVFAKELMAKYKVPTAAFKVFENADEAKRYVDEINMPCVIKADGLAQGKGVIIAQTAEEAKQGINSIMQERIFGEAGNKIIIEDCLEGQEASILVLTDSKSVAPLASSQDHKRIFDNDQGPNTGGMGAYSPAPVVTQKLFDEILDKVVNRTISGLVKEGIEYKGILYVGIMITKDGPKVLEFNVRFGDPEAQAILPRLKSDIVEVMSASVDGNLSRFKNLNWETRACVCVVCASGGYPGNYDLGKEIFGLEEADKREDIIVFHAGTKKLQAPCLPDRQASSKLQAKYFTSGGRVLGVTGLGDTIKQAIDKTYQATAKIHFEGMQYRKDIGKKAILKG